VAPAGRSATAPTATKVAARLMALMTARRKRDSPLGWSTDPNGTALPRANNMFVVLLRLLDPARSRSIERHFHPLSRPFVNRGIFVTLATVAFKSASRDCRPIVNID
jgi:hypothetical protein